MRFFFEFAILLLNSCSSILIEVDDLDPSCTTYQVQRFIKFRGVLYGWGDGHPVDGDVVGGLRGSHGRVMSSEMRCQLRCWCWC